MNKPYLYLHAYYCVAHDKGYLLQTINEDIDEVDTNIHICGEDIDDNSCQFEHHGFRSVSESAEIIEDYIPDQHEYNRFYSRNWLVEEYNNNIYDQEGNKVV